MKKSRIKKIECVPGRISEVEKIKMIKEAGVVVYPSHSIQELTQQLIKAMSLSPEDKALQREKASRWVANFTWERHVDALEEVFKSFWSGNNV